MVFGFPDDLLDSFVVIRFKMTDMWNVYPHICARTKYLEEVGDLVMDVPCVQNKLVNQASNPGSSGTPVPTLNRGENWM